MERTFNPRKVSLALLRRQDTGAYPVVERPRTRGDCLEGGSNAQRPCPFVSCKYHLYLDEKNDKGCITFNFPALEPEDMQHSCALDIADAGEHTLEEVGDLMQLTRERIRQIETKAAEEARKDELLRQHAEELHDLPAGPAVLPKAWPHRGA